MTVALNMKRRWLLEAGSGNRPANAVHTDDGAHGATLFSNDS
ncbi:MAG: hypothetical protein AVDCRST_MAG43-2188 [uncultured Thermomicrobiales bacterium]|uniref:Uncharacterized protein n=1 Tax=uncultured Thermomicrobiales bacterium TaxID=1645740 RepID=A0A6J4V3I1_9BACT|nr:MAG: hypothetical protein AVDCRST_MAG43-2188 [uncultured Thermomicrobiales bacterium]